MQLSVQKAQQFDLKEVMAKDRGMKNISNEYYVSWRRVENSTDGRLIQFCG